MGHCFLAGRRDVDREAIVFEGLCQDFTNSCVVFNEQQFHVDNRTDRTRTGATDVSRAINIGDVRDETVTQFDE